MLAARALLGKDIEGAPIERVIAHPAALEALEGAHADPDGEVELTGLDGSRRHWLMRTARLGDGATLIRFVDRSEARAAEQMRVDFVANASHELRTPLATLIGYTETLREQSDDIDPATRERFLAVVHDEARRMQHVVEDLISLVAHRGREIQRPDRRCRARSDPRPGDRGRAADGRRTRIGARPRTSRRTCRRSRPIAARSCSCSTIF